MYASSLSEFQSYDCTFYYLSLVVCVTCVLYIIIYKKIYIYIIYINDFDENSLEIIKRESKIGVNIYYIKYGTLRPFYFVINRLIDYTEEIEGSSDKYLVVLTSLHNKDINILLDNIWESIED